MTTIFNGCVILPYGCTRVSFPNRYAGHLGGFHQEIFQWEKERIILTRCWRLSMPPVGGTRWQNDLVPSTPPPTHIYFQGRLLWERLPFFLPSTWKFSRDRGRKNAWLVPTWLLGERSLRPWQPGEGVPPNSTPSPASLFCGTPGKRNQELALLLSPAYMVKNQEGWVQSQLRHSTSCGPCYCTQKKTWSNSQLYSLLVTNVELSLRITILEWAIHYCG
jgi:hypothetical protein